MKSYLLLCLITNICIAMDSPSDHPAVPAGALREGWEPVEGPPLEELGIIELLTTTFENIKAKMKALKIEPRGTYYHTPESWPYSLSATVQDDDPMQEIHYSFDTSSKNESDEILEMIKKLATDTYEGYKFKDSIKNDTHKGFVSILDNGVAMAVFYSKKWIEASDKRAAIESEQRIREAANKFAHHSRYRR